MVSSFISCSKALVDMAMWPAKPSYGRIIFSKLGTDKTIIKVTKVALARANEKKELSAYRKIAVRRQVNTFGL